MVIPVQVTFRNLRRVEGIVTDVRERAQRLGTYYGRIIGCRVAVEMPHRRHEEGNRLRVRIELAVPDDTIVVSHDASLVPDLRDLGAEKVSKRIEVEPDHKYLGQTVRDAFEVARRQLQDYSRRRRGDVKQHSRSA